MTTTHTHTAHCIEMVKMSIAENNLDTLVEMGINDRIALIPEQPSRWMAVNKLIDDELEVQYVALYGGCRRPTDEAAIEWLACGNVECQDEDRCGR